MRTHGDPAQMAALIEQSKKSGTKIPPIGKLVESAQTRLEQRDAKGRKQVLDFDDVMNLQREIVYDFRNNVLTTENIRELALHTIEESIADSVHEQLSECDPSNPDFTSLLEWVRRSFLLEIEDPSSLAPDRIEPEITKRICASYEHRVGGVPPEFLDREERRAQLFAIDHGWQEHLAEMEELREGIFLRSQGQKDPLVEYKNEAFELFSALMAQIKSTATTNLFHLALSIEALKAQK